MLLETKKCHTCNIEKSREEFYKNKSRAGDKRSAQCKDCDKARKRKLWHEGGSYKLAKQRSYLKTTYGNEVFNFEKPKQCPICLRTEDEVRDTLKRAFVVDHCHLKGHVRGYLCTQCNKGLGYFRDNVEDLQRAINYLNATSKEVKSNA